MRPIKVGEFEISVWDPYPIPCTLRYGEQEIEFTHRDLPDLKYAIEKAMSQAAKKLGRDSHEVFINQPPHYER